MRVLSVLDQPWHQSRCCYFRPTWRRGVASSPRRPSPPRACAVAGLAPPLPPAPLPSLAPVPREDLGFRFISEQVSHHPPISAFHSEGLHQDFLFHGSIYPKLKFWGKSVEAEPRGTITLELLR